MESFKAVSRYMQDSPTLHHDIVFIVVAVVAIASLWTVITLWDRYQAGHANDAPRYETLFKELCHAHRLAEPESRWLQTVAVQNNYDDAARLFYTPQVLEGQLPSGGETAEMARTLLKKLFAIEEPES